MITPELLWKLADGINDFHSGKRKRKREPRTLVSLSKRQLLALNLLVEARDEIPESAVSAVVKQDAATALDTLRHALVRAATQVKRTEHANDTKGRPRTKHPR